MGLTLAPGFVKSKFKVGVCAMAKPTLKEQKIQVNIPSVSIIFFIKVVSYKEIAGFILPE